MFLANFIAFKKNTKEVEKKWLPFCGGNNVV